MKKVISIFSLIVILIIGVFLLTGRGNNETTTGGGSSSSGESKKSGSSVSEITTENWQNIVEENFGLTLNLPEGWSVTSAKSPNGSTNLKIVFSVDVNFSYADFGQEIYDELKKDSIGDIYKYGDTSKVYSNFKEAGTSGIASFTAKVDGDSGKQVVVNYYNNQSTVDLNLLRMGNW